MESIAVDGDPDTTVRLWITVPASQYMGRPMRLRAFFGCRNQGTDGIYPYTAILTQPQQEERGDSLIYSANLHNVSLALATCRPHEVKLHAELIPTLSLTVLNSFEAFLKVEALPDDSRQEIRDGEEQIR